MHNAFSLGKVEDIEVKIHYSWFLVFSLVVWSLAQFYFPANYPGWTSTVYWLSASVAAFFLFASVLFHEFSHSLVGRKHKIVVKSITLFVFGGVAEMVTEPQKPSDEFRMAIAGPLASFFLAGVFWVVASVNIGLTGMAIAHYLFLINLILGAFNLAPAFPLDGGRVFRSALWAASDNIEKATRQAVTASRIIAFILTLWGIKMLVDNNYVGGLWIIVISWFLLQAAGSSLKQQAMEAVLESYKIEKVMDREFKKIPPKMLLRDLAKAFLDYKQGGFPVEEGDRLVGLVTLHDIRNVPRTKWASTRVESIMTKADKLETLKLSDNAYDAFLKLTNNDFGRLPVVENNKVVGLVTRNSIILLLAVKCDKCV